MWAVWFYPNQSSSTIVDGLSWVSVGLSLGRGPDAACDMQTEDHVSISVWVSLLGFILEEDSDVLSSFILSWSQGVQTLGHGEPEVRKLKAQGGGPLSFPV